MAPPETTERARAARNGRVRRLAGALGGSGHPRPPGLEEGAGRRRAGPADRSPAAQHWTLLLVCIASALLLINVSAPNVALPDIGRGLGADFSELQWVVSGYALMLAATLLTAGALADRFGRRRLFLAGLLAFALSSALCAAAPAPLFLIVARGLQGVSGAVLFSSSLALLAQDFTGAARGRALGAWGATVAAAFAIGPLEGGVLDDAFDWRAIFVLNVGLALLALPIALRYLRESRDPDAGGIDWGGTATLSVGLFVGVFALIRGNALGWGSLPILGCFAGAAVLLAAFAVIEHRQVRPMLDPRLFRKPTFTAASLVAVALAVSTFGPILYITLFLLDVRGASPPVVGLELAPFAVISFVVSVVGGRYSEKLSLRGVLVGGLLLGAGGLLLMRGVHAGTSWTHLVPGMLVAGAGVGFVNPAMTYAALGVVPRARSGMASGINNTFRQLGLAAGIAALGALLSASVESGMLDRLARGLGHRAEVAHMAATGDVAHAVALVGPAGRAGVVGAYRVAFSDALNQVFLVGAGFAVAGALIAFALVRKADFVAEEGEPA